MRTSLNLDDDVLERLRHYAEDRSVTLGKAASELIRKGLQRSAADPAGEWHLYLCAASKFTEGFL